MKLPIEPGLPLINDVPALKKRITELWRLLAAQVNGVSEGSIASHYQAQSTAPTSGTYQRGDVVPNLTPSELGDPGAKYVVTGFTCIASGTPGTWVENRSLTGN